MRGRPNYEIHVDPMDSKYSLSFRLVGIYTSMNSYILHESEREGVGVYTESERLVGVSKLQYILIN